MSEQNSFEEIDRHINAVKLEDFQPGGRHHFTAAAATAAPGDVLKKICAIYRVIRPILIAIENFPLLPKKWRDALKVFTDLLDTLCPSS
ncbi:MAG TPA: hypothetical protein VGS57_14785 [Thermoanaerobaculia bacterium]|nr:hypothetical protein [Thermoanaerobaculia bacterium]